MLSTQEMNFSNFLENLFSLHGRSRDVAKTSLLLKPQKNFQNIHVGLN